MAAYNKARFVKELLQKTEGKPPSFTVNLYPDYWSLNNGSRFHYHIPMASLLDDIRAQRIPVDFLEIFDSARVPFYEGCMVVQILDYRPQSLKESVLEKPEQTRVVLHPNSETLWADICSLNQRYGKRWTDLDALEVEARISLATTPPLCLDPDPHLARIANHIMRASMPTIPSSLKRKAATMEPEDDENDKARRIKIIQHMATRPNRPNPSFHLFDALQRARQNLQNLQSQKSSSPVQQPPSQINTNPQSSPAPAPPGTPTINGVQVQSPTEPLDDKKKKRKSETPQASFTSPAFVQTNGTQVPVPPTPTAHQFVNTHSTGASSPASINAHSPMQIPMYTTAQGMPDSTMRVPTPAQQPPLRYTQSPRPPSRTPVTVQQPPRPPSQPQPPTQTVHHQTVHHTPQGPKVALPPVAPASFSTQPAGSQQFLPQQHTQNGVQKPTAAPNVVAAAARLPQAQNLSFQQMQFLQFRLQQQQQQRLQAQKQNGRATPQTGIPSPAHQPQSALSPLHQAASPQSTNQPAPVARSPLPQASPAPAVIPPQAAQQAQNQMSQSYIQTQQAAMPRSPAQQPQQQPGHGQHAGYAQFNMRGMMPANPTAAHQALHTAVVNAAAAAAGSGRTATPAATGIPDHHPHPHPQHPPHPTMQGQPPTTQQPPPRTPRTPQPLPSQASQTPSHQSQPPVTQHTQQSQQPLTQSQMQMYSQMYGYPQVQLNVAQGAGGRIPASYWGNLQGIPNAGNMAGMPGIQGMSSMQGMPQGMMSGMQGMGRGIPPAASKIAAAGVGAGHVHGAGGVGPMQGKTAVPGGVQR